ncbi:hypothetical protein HHK36_018275 [Tetracentron sinense]|uniref:Response regulatory domain-containing protein n=1 Tax=Tetracentron sinense TaxID=13715 RepID=A0A834Z3L2_TETSI|nr:hypothetical protein HHK36_018275 [Tetracentron sinense]
MLQRRMEETKMVAVRILQRRAKASIELRNKTFNQACDEPRVLSRYGGSFEMRYKALVLKALDSVHLRQSLAQLLNNGGAENKGLAELNNHMRDEHKEVRDGVVGEGQGLSEEDESRINEVAEDVNDGCEGAFQPLVVLQRLQPQPQGPVVHWDRFLPLRSLKVLLVENDDSTRHVVGALLRNCSYEVTAAANGLQAWKILEDLTNQIDLILTEVVMPGLSGIGLLCKIMNHKTCKNIPVIMMSSYDSMGTVFKCLSKGAVDFLVKPVRKNELKNLWQHVWRRCHSSSGSGSESATQTQKSTKSKSGEESDNNIGSNGEDDNGSIGLNVRDRSDNGSGTQVSPELASGMEGSAVLELESKEGWTGLPPERVSSDIVGSVREGLGFSQEVTPLVGKRLVPIVFVLGRIGWIQATTASTPKDVNAALSQDCLGERLVESDPSSLPSSWTKRAVEVDSPQPMLTWDQLADPLDSTCAQFIHSKLETCGNHCVHMTATRECQEQDEKLDNVAMGKDLEIGVHGNPDLQLQYPSEKVSTNLTGAKHDKLPEEQLNKRLLEFNHENPIGELRDQAADLIGAIVNGTDLQMESGVFEAPNGLSKSLETYNKVIYDTKELPSLELSLKRSRGVGIVGTATRDERNVLRHSDLSAFSRYNTTSTANQVPTGNVGSCSPFDNSSEAVKTESMHNFPFHSNGTPPNQRSNGSSNNDMGSTTNNVFTKPAVFNNKSASTSTVKCLHPSGFQPVQNGHLCPPQHVISDKTDDVTVNKMQAQPRDIHQQVEVQHHYHHYHHHHHHVHNTQQQQLPSDHDDFPSKKMAAAASQGGSSNVLSGPIEGNAGNYSLNGSASGSNHGSNGQNGSSTAVNAGGMNMESDNGVAGENGADGSSGSGSRVDQNRFAQREAALTKFRQKRKERCFEKKVTGLVMFMLVLGEQQFNKTR